jgi:Flp pilus assembly protein TadD
MRQGQFANAVASFQRAGALQPDDSEIQDHLGQGLMQAGRSSEGLVAFLRPLRWRRPAQAPTTISAWRLMQTGQFPEAVASLRRAAELQPDSTETLNNFGVALMRAGRVAEANRAASTRGRSAS